MKKRFISLIAAAALSLSLLAGCAKTPQTTLYDDGVVKAFLAVAPADGLISQTAAKDGNDYLVTVITSSSVREYPVDANFAVGPANTIFGGTAATALEETAEEAPLSPLERAFEEALTLSGLAKADVEGFDFDRDTYMGKAVYKVEIEDAAAEYSYIFSADDFSLLSSKTELKHADPSQDGSSYITEAQAKEIALEAAGTTESEARNFTLKLVPENGRRLYIAGFDLGGFRYTVEIDAVNGGIVKFSKRVLDENVAYPDVPQLLSEEEAKEIALGFAFPAGTDETVRFRKVKLDYEKGRFVYEVEFTAGGKEYELDIDAASGEILDVEIDDEGGYVPPQSGEFITREEAIGIVRGVVGEDAFILDVEIEVRNTAGEKRYYYEIEVKVNGMEREFYVDALTGEIAANDDYTGNPLAPALTEADALKIALDDLGLTEEQITSKRIKLEREDGRLCYEIKFFVGTTEYKIGVDANSGKILEKEIDTEHGTLPSYPSESGYITRSAAADAVKQYFAEKGKEARIDESEIEWEDAGSGANKRYFYEVEAYVDGREYDCYVDALTGEVRVKGELVESGALIGEERALEIALEKFSLSRNEVRVVKVKLDEEDGVLIYEVEFKVKSMEYSFEIDAETGEILEYDRSFDD